MLLPPTATSPKVTTVGVAVRETVDPVPEPGGVLVPEPGGVLVPEPGGALVPEPGGVLVPEPDGVLGELAPKKLPGPAPPPPQEESKQRSAVQKATAPACAPNSEKKDLDFFTTGSSVSYRPNDLN